MLRMLWRSVISQASPRAGPQLDRPLPATPIPAPCFRVISPDVTLALQQPWVSILQRFARGVAGGPAGLGAPHPPAYGAFPHVLRKYVREEKKLTLEDAIRNFSAQPAERTTTW